MTIKQNNTSTSTDTLTNAGTRIKEAYDKHAERIKAIPTTKYIPVTFDVPLAYTTSQGKLKRLGTIKAEVRDLPHINKQLIDELDERLLALGHALGLYYAQAMSPDQLDALVASVTASRQQLASDAAALARRNLYPSDRLVDLKGPISRQKIGFDVLGMTTAFRANWSEIQGKTPITLEELDQYDADVDRMLVAIGDRSSEELERATQVRDAALTYFAESWEELRRGVSHLRWHDGDLDEHAPTVFTNRNHRAVGKKPAQPGDEAPTAPSTPPVTPVVATDDDDGPFTT